jgi:hypothetical protein
MENSPKPLAQIIQEAEIAENSSLAARADNFISDTLRDLDLGLLSAARELYQRYMLVHDSRAKEPIGVVVNRHSHRSKLLFRGGPVLLPEECFVSVQEVRRR